MPKIKSFRILKDLFTSSNYFLGELPGGSNDIFEEFDNGFVNLGIG